MILRPAEPADLPGILAIYNEVAAHTTAIYDRDPATLAERTAWYEARRARGFPVLVAAEGDAVLGFSSYGDWRPRWGYRFTVEHSVHVRAERRGRGIGRALVEALFPLARAQGLHAMIGGIDAEAEASLRLHRSLGFREIGRFPEVGHKFGRWLDLVCVQRMIEPAPVDPVPGAS